MDCIESSLKAKQIKLLTQADKTAKLEELFVKHRRKSDVFLPDESFYQRINGPEDAERMADEIFKWLGIKHRSLEFHIDPKQEKLVSYSHDKGTSHVTLGWQCLKDPFVCGEAVAHAVTHHLLLARSKITLGNSGEDEELTDLGTIYAGLCVLILNSFSAKPGSLGSMAGPNYIAECLDYFEGRRVVGSIWQPYVLPGVIPRRLLQDSVPEKLLVPYVRSQVKRKRTAKRKLAALAVFIAVAIGTAVFLLADSPKYLSAELQAKKDTIALLKHQYEQCEDTVIRKQRTWDQSDIFMQMQIEADKSRCKSIHNRYNYEVNQFNSRL